MLFLQTFLFNFCYWWKQYNIYSSIHMNNYEGGDFKKFTFLDNFEAC